MLDELAFSCDTTFVQYLVFIWSGIGLSLQFLVMVTLGIPQA